MIWNIVPDDVEWGSILSGMGVQMVGSEPCFIFWWCNR